MKNNVHFNKMFDAIKNAHYILVVTHKNPDLDTLSSGLALSNYFFDNRIKHKVFNIDCNLPRKLDFLSKFEKISSVLPKFYDLIIYVDCANEDRVGITFENNIKTISIDHHHTNTNFADINIVDEEKGSTAELLYYFYKCNNIKISRKVAECLYVGIYDDSLAFTTPRTTINTFSAVSDLLSSKIDVSFISESLKNRESLAKFKAISKIMTTLDLQNEGKVATVYLEDTWTKETGVIVNECDDIVDSVLSIGIVKIVAYFRIVDNKIRVSLRSKGEIDVSVIASKYNGGGHRNSSGFSFDSLDIFDTKEKVVATILDYIEY